MKRLTKALLALLSTGLLLAVLAGCNSSSSTSTTPADTTVVLTVTSGTKSKTFTMTDLKALSAISGYSGTKNKKGEINTNTGIVSARSSRRLERGMPLGNIE